MARIEETNRFTSILINNNKYLHYCRRFMSWFLQIIVLVILLSMITIYSISSTTFGARLALLIIYIFFHTLYFIIQIYSRTYKKIDKVINIFYSKNTNCYNRELKNTKDDLITYDNNNLYYNKCLTSFLEKLYYQKCKIEFECTNYHYEERSGCKYEKITNKNNKDFIYYSWKDISNDINIDNLNINIKKTKFLNVKLDLEYKLYDKYTINDFNEQRNNFCKSNKNKDYFMYTNIIKIIDNVENNNIVFFNYNKLLNEFYKSKLISTNEYNSSNNYDELSNNKINDKDKNLDLNILKSQYNFNNNDNLHSFEFPKLFSTSWFILFVIIPLAEFYKLYINYFFVDINIKVIKEIATRDDLNSNIFEDNYKKNCPKLIFKNTIIKEYFIKTHVVHHNCPNKSNKNLVVKNNVEWDDYIPTKLDIKKQINNNYINTDNIEIEFNN